VVVGALRHFDQGMMARACLLINASGKRQIPARDHEQAR